MIVMQRSRGFWLNADFFPQFFCQSNNHIFEPVLAGIEMYNPFVSGQRIVIAVNFLMNVLCYKKFVK